MAALAVFPDDAVGMQSSGSTAVGTINNASAAAAGVAVSLVGVSSRPVEAALMPSTFAVVAVPFHRSILPDLEGGHCRESLAGLWRVRIFPPTPRR